MVKYRAMATLPTFHNEPFLDFTNDGIRRAQSAAIDELARRGPRDVPVVIAGERQTTAATFSSRNPSDPGHVLAMVARAGEAEVRRAVDAADRAFDRWRWVPARERAGLLLRAAAAVRKRRYELNALACLEAGKTWPEADLELAEAVDFLELYAREAMRIAAPQPLTPLAGEMNELRYIPLGVGAVIPPWNFPIAIMAGMTMAAVAAGNTVVLKPSSDTPLIAWTFFEILEQCGLPPGVVNFVPGPGGVVGEGLCAHPRTRFIAFTGSRDVGVRLNTVAAAVAPGQIWLKRVVAEMGGKDFIIVDEAADLDDAAAAVAGSAFGYQGQKCSACSRAIVHHKVYDAFVAKLIPRVEVLTVGPPRDPKVAMGPVINEAAMKSIGQYVAAGKQDGLALLSGGGRAPAADATGGYFLQPTVFGNVPENHRIACEEIFGPVLAVIRARDFDHEIAIANATEYGLTGSIFTLDREKIARARRTLHCGNLYVNRKCTGAMVGVHPFGGFNMSGTDSKAGGTDYLGLFSQAKVVSEKLG